MFTFYRGETREDDRLIFPRQRRLLHDLQEDGHLSNLRTAIDRNATRSLNIYIITQVDASWCLVLGRNYLMIALASLVYSKDT